MKVAGALLLLPILSTLCLAAPIDLQIDEKAWEKKVFLNKGDGITEEQACAMGIVRDEKLGPCLFIGPWGAGNWGVRMQYAKTLPMKTGILRGMYRTQGVLPSTVEVSVYFMKGKERLAKRGVRLAPSAEWKAFEQSIWLPPAGTDGLLPAVGLSDKTEGTVYFARLSIEEGDPKLQVPAELPKITRPAPPANLEKSGFYRLQQAGEAWWLVTPDGKPFYSIGVDGGSFNDIETGRGKAKWMQEHGFNSLGGWSNMKSWAMLNDKLEAEKAATVAGFAACETGTLKDVFDFLKDSKGQTQGSAGHQFPDPFDPKWDQAYRKRVAQIAEQVGGKKWFAAWFADNEVTHKEIHRQVWSKHCSEAFVAWLKGKYGTSAALNAAWKTQFASFDDLAAQKPEPGVLPSPKRDDFKTFSRQIVRKFIEVEVKAIRDADPNHLIFSNRFMLHEISELEEFLDLYKAYDGIAVNLYPANQTAGLSDNERAALAVVHEKTGKPILITEWSIPAIDSHLYDNPKKLDWSWDEAVPTQQERSRQAARVTIDFHNLPFLVGSHWFTWKDFDSEKRQANRGLIRADGKPWPELTEALKKANAAIGSR